MRFLMTVIFLSGFIASAQAQSLDEYNNVPPGLMMEQKNISEQAKAPESLATQKITMTLDEVIAAYHEGKFDIVAQSLPPFAENGYHQAEELLGLMYRSGQGVDKSPEKARLWLGKAAEAGRPLAMHHLGVTYYMGEGGAADNVRALTWLKLAMLHYPEGTEKSRATEDYNNLAAQTSRRDKEFATEAVRNWLDKKGERVLLDAQ